jgi:hypothetical protein
MAQIVGTGLDLVTGANIDGVPVPAANIKKQTATELWVLAPATIPAGTEVAISLDFSGGTGPVETTKPNGKFTVTDFYIIKDRIYANANGANSILSTTLFSTFSVCDVDNALVAKTDIDIMMVSTTSDTKLQFCHPKGSTGTTNNFRCISTGTPVGGWDIADRNATALRLASATTAAQFDDMINLATTFAANTNPAANTADVSPLYTDGEAAHENVMIVFRTRMAATAENGVSGTTPETTATRKGFIRTVKAYLVTPYNSRLSSLDIVIKVQRLAAD